MIDVKDVVKTYKNGNLELTVLKGLNLGQKRRVCRIYGTKWKWKIYSYEHFGLS